MVAFCIGRHCVRILREALDEDAASPSGFFLYSTHVALAAVLLTACCMLLRARMQCAEEKCVLEGRLLELQSRLRELTAESLQREERLFRSLTESGARESALLSRLREATEAAEVRKAAAPSEERPLLRMFSLQGLPGGGSKSAPARKRAHLSECSSEQLNEQGSVCHSDFAAESPGGSIVNGQASRAPTELYDADADAVDADADNADCASDRSVTLRIPGMPQVTF